MIKACTIYYDRQSNFMKQDVNPQAPLPENIRLAVDDFVQKLNMVPLTSRNQIVVQEITIVEKKSNDDKAITFWILLIVFLLIGFWLCIPCLFCCFTSKEITGSTKKKTTVQQVPKTFQNVQ